MQGWTFTHLLIVLQISYHLKILFLAGFLQGNQTRGNQTVLALECKEDATTVPTQMDK